MLTVADIDRIKSTELGRAWLAAFVRRVWDMLGELGQERLYYAMQEVAPLSGPSRFWTRAEEGRDERREGKRLVALGLLGETLPVINLHLRKGQGRWLTPLGVEVHLHGRRCQVVRFGSLRAPSKGPKL